MSRPWRLLGVPTTFLRPRWRIPVWCGFFSDQNSIVVQLLGMPYQLSYVYLSQEGTGVELRDSQGSGHQRVKPPTKVWWLQAAHLFGFTKQGECCYGWIAGNKSYDLEQQTVYITWQHLLKHDKLSSRGSGQTHKFLCSSLLSHHIPFEWGLSAQTFSLSQFAENSQESELGLAPCIPPNSLVLKRNV